MTFRLLRSAVLAPVLAPVLAAALALTLAACGDDPDLTTEVISTATIVCGMCEDQIEKAVYAVEGVKSVAVDLKGKTVEVKYLSSRTNLPTLERAITDIGYDANGRPADPGAYDKLDACCRIN